MNAGRRQGARRHGGERRGATLSSTPWATLLLAAAALLVHALPALAPLLELDRGALARGGAWRLFTGHLVHFSREHLVLDVAAFLALGLACELRAPRTTRRALGAAALVISAGVVLLTPEVQRYRGLSGLDAALFAVLASLLVAQPRTRRLGLLLAALFAAKLAFELATGRTPFVDAAAGGFTPLPLAHLLGAGTGLAVALLAAKEALESDSRAGGARGTAERGLRTTL